MSDLRCARHPDREAEYGIATHYINSTSWQDTLRAEQTFGPFCSECRLEFIAWATKPAPIYEIASRKRQGIDCTEDESAIVKHYFDHYMSEADAEWDVFAGLFSLEFAEWCDEQEKGTR